MKICTKCNIDKKDTDFNENRAICRMCRSEIGRDKLRTEEGVIRRIYGSQKTHSKSRGHNPPSYSARELSEFLYKTDKYKKLYFEWKESGYKKGLKPSVDRLDDTLGYSIDNIQVITWDENKAKGHTDSMTEKISTGNMKRRVAQLTKNGELVMYHISIRQAARSVHRACSTISGCISGRNGAITSAGHKWMYAEDFDIRDRVKNEILTFDS